MQLSDLNPNEQLALVGLVKQIVHADQQLSSEEGETLAAVAKELGPQAWNALVAKAKVELTTPDDTWRLAREVARPEARAAILRVLHDMAGSDELVAAEAAILDWLAKVWADGPGADGETTEHGYAEAPTDADEDEESDEVESFVLLDEE